MHAEEPPTKKLHARKVHGEEEDKIESDKAAQPQAHAILAAWRREEESRASGVALPYRREP